MVSKSRLLNDVSALRAHYLGRATHYRTQAAEVSTIISTTAANFDLARASYCDQIANDLQTIITKHEGIKENG